jgi:hypothetical protein
MLSPPISREWRLDLTGAASNSRSPGMLAAVRRPAMCQSSDHRGALA